MKWIFFLIFISSFGLSAQAQAVVDDFWEPIHWRNDPGLFLEPNQFSTIKEVKELPLWLQVGYGKSFISFGSSNDFHVGLEGLVWSRLNILPGFRFPVQTADYFFGAYIIWEHNNLELAQHYRLLSAGDCWRFRISHISSHLVDGTDSIRGGSSSEYSREFVELSRQFRVWQSSEVFLTIGVRGYFHQVSKIEPWVEIPASLTCPIVFKGYDGLYAFISSGDGPVWPSIAGGLRAQKSTGSSSTSGLELYYYYGASWAGTDAGAKVSQLKLQLDVRDF